MRSISSPTTPTITADARPHCLAHSATTPPYYPRTHCSSTNHVRPIPGLLAPGMPPRVGHPAQRPFFMVPEMCFFCSILHIFFHYIVKRFKKGLYMTLITCVAGLTTRSYVVVLCSQRIIKNSFIKRIYRGPYRRQAIPEEEAWNGGTD